MHHSRIPIFFCFTFIYTNTLAFIIDCKKSTRYQELQGFCRKTNTVISLSSKLPNIYYNNHILQTVHISTIF